MKRGSVVRMVAAGLVCAALAGCGSAADPAAAVLAPAVTTTTTPPPDPASVGANELGLVPVLMYHQIVAVPGGEYDQTPAEFTAELDRLYREGYRPVTLSRYLSGDLNLPAGTHPVVLTFDDSTRSQLSFTDSGAVTPDSAVGLLEEFAARHPDFPATASFYVNNEPFGDDPRALPWLAAHGYEIGAHTASHANLGRLDATGVQQEFAENVRAIAAAVPGCQVRTMALPLGVSPADHALARAGSWGGVGYAFDGVLLVGSNPAPGPFGALDPGGIPRIRSGRGDVPFDSDYWLDQLAAQPGQRYTADGDPAHVSFPSALAGELAPRWSGQARPY